MQTLAASFPVGAGDYLAFAGVGPYYPQMANNAVGSDATYASSSEPSHYPYSFTAIPPTRGGDFLQSGPMAIHKQVTPSCRIPLATRAGLHGIGVEYTPSAGQVFPTAPRSARRT